MDTTTFVTMLILSFLIFRLGKFLYRVGQEWLGAVAYFYSIFNVCIAVAGWLTYGK